MRLRVWRLGMRERRAGKNRMTKDRNFESDRQEGARKSLTETHVCISLCVSTTYRIQYAQSGCVGC